MPDSGAFFEVVGASFGYAGRGEVLREVDLTIDKRELVGIVGANGAGKSTLLRGLIGLAPASSGAVRLRGDPVRALPRHEIARRCAYLPQDLRPAPGLSALEVVLLGRAAHRAAGPAAWVFDTPDDVVAARAALHDVGAGALAARAFRELSGGERRLVVLAQALAQAGGGVLLDEPTAALDLRAQWTIADKLVEVADRRSLALVLVTHDLALAARVCARLVLLAGGRVLADGPPGDVLRPDLLQRAFAVALEVVRLAGSGTPLVIPAGRAP